jgi:hypothetical protein
VGAYLMSIWGLPGSLIFPCAFNQSYEDHFDGTYNAINSLYFANLFADETYVLEDEFKKINDSEFETKIKEWEVLCSETVTGFNYE